MTEHTIHFDNPHEAQELAGRFPTLLPEIENNFKVELTARDTWLHIKGSEEQVELTQQFFTFLRNARNKGMRLHLPGVLYALEAFMDGKSKQLEELYGYRVEVTVGKPAIFPKTFGQRDYLEAVKSNIITIGLGPAGTGKTYLAMAMAVHSLMKGEVSRIILTRPAVEAGETLGFLPGDLNEKISPYLRPLYDAMYDMMPPEDIQKLMDRGVIEVAPLAFMRGRTLNNAFIILDEAQNTTQEQMLMFLTRLGFGSRCVITGDPSQVDLARGVRSGLHEARDALGSIPEIAIISLGDRDVVRHELVQKIVQAYRSNRGPSKSG